MELSLAARSNRARFCADSRRDLLGEAYGLIAMERGLTMRADVRTWSD
jgi:hypothetical protein